MQRYSRSWYPPLLAVTVFSGDVRRLVLAGVPPQLLAAPPVARNAPFASGVTRLFARPFVRRALLVGRLAAFTCNLPLLGGVHRGKSTIFLGHVFPPPSRAASLSPDPNEIVRSAQPRCNGSATA
jgi:hypothetical protein